VNHYAKCRLAAFKFFLDCLFVHLIVYLFSYLLFICQLACLQSRACVRATAVQ